MVESLTLTPLHFKKKIKKYVLPTCSLHTNRKMSIVYNRRRCYIRPTPQKRHMKLELILNQHKLCVVFNPTYVYLCGNNNNVSLKHAFGFVFVKC